MYAVLGITGKVGGAVAETLLANGEQVRGVARDPEKARAWKSKGADIVAADYDDRLVETLREPGTALQVEEQGGIAPKISLTSESLETIRLPQGQDHRTEQRPRCRQS